MKTVKDTYTSIYNNKTLLRQGYRSLAQVYEQGTSPQTIVRKDVLQKISGITKPAVLQKLYNLYVAITDNAHFYTFLKNGVTFSHGGDIHRVYDASKVITQATCLDISRHDFAGKPLVVTYSSSILKIRTPAPSVQRIATFNSITDKHVESAHNAIQSRKGFNTTHNGVLRVLAVYDLFVTQPSSIKLVQKIAAGLGAEFAQVEEFNSSLEGLPPVKLYLKIDGKLVDQGIKFNRAKKVTGSGKADIELIDTKQNKPVYWISYKEGKYDPNQKATFQQWGSIGELYKSSPAITRYFDTFFSMISDRLPSVEYPLNRAGKKLIESDPKIKDLWEAHAYKFDKRGTDLYKYKDSLQRLYFYPQGTSEYYLDLFNKKNILKNHDLTELMLKSIYGLDFEIDKKVPFGSENVNIVLQSPTALKLKPLMDDNEDLEAMVLDITEHSHLLENPSLPDSEKHLPCLYTRFTKSLHFFFNQETECIIGVRPLVYPIGNAETGTSQEVFLKQ